MACRYPILVAIDDYNLLHSHAVNLYDPDFQKLNPPLIRPEKLVLPSLFMSWQNHGIVNGTMVCAMTNTKPRNTKEFDAQFPRLPTTYTVPRYNREEFLTIVANYEQNGYIHCTPHEGSHAQTDAFLYLQRRLPRRRTSTCTTCAQAAVAKFTRCWHCIKVEPLMVLVLPCRTNGSDRNA